MKTIDQNQQINFTIRFSGGTPISNNDVSKRSGVLDESYRRPHERYPPKDLPGGTRVLLLGQ